MTMTYLFVQILSQKHLNLQKSYFIFKAEYKVQS